MSEGNIYLMKYLHENLHRIGGWPYGCDAISVSARGHIWGNSKIPTRFSKFMGVWTDDSFWGGTTNGFSSPLFYSDIKGSENILPITKDEFDGFIQSNIKAP